MAKLVYPIQKTTSFFLLHVFATVVSNLFLLLLFLVYIPIVYHSHSFLNVIPKHVDSHSREELMNLTFSTRISIILINF